MCCERLGAAPPEDDHFDWAEFEKLIARDSEQSYPSMVPAPTGCPSGPLAAHLDSGTVVPERLADTEVIDAIVGFEHLVSWAGARQARLLAEFARRRPGDDPSVGISEKVRSTSRWAPDEIALALSHSRITAAAKLGQSTQLSEVLGDTLTAWETGRLDALKVRAICDATLRLDEAQARHVQARVLPRAATQTLTQLKAALQRAVLAVDPDGGDQCHQKAHRERRVVLTPVEDGMATLWACMTAPDAQTCYGWLTALARGLGQADPRGMDARRTDLMRDLLTGRLTIIPTDPAGGGTVPAPDPSNSPPSNSPPSNSHPSSAEAADTHPTSARADGSHGDTDTGVSDTGAADAAEPATSDIGASDEAGGHEVGGHQAGGQSRSRLPRLRLPHPTTTAAAVATGAGRTRQTPGPDRHPTQHP